MSKAYSSNLTRAQDEFLSDLIPEAKPGGRKHEVDMWEILKAIFYFDYLKLFKHPLKAKRNQSISQGCRKSC